MISLILSACPRRVRPAAARMMASICPSSSFFRRVSTLPRKSTIFKSGRLARSCARRRRLLVPSTLPSGSSSMLLYLLLTKASPAFARSVIAVRHSPSGSTVGISFKLCTARSMVPSKSSCSISLVNRPLPPIFASGTSKMRSPLVTIFLSVTSQPGYSSRRRPAI